MSVRRVALVGCGKAKLDQAAPARELYTSNLFKLSARYAQEAFDGWYVVSALHGLVEPERVVAPYDFSLAEMRVPERESWAARVASLLCRRERGAHFTLLAGGHYRYLSGYLRWTMVDGYIGPLRGAVAGVDEPLEGLGIGLRMAALKYDLARIDGLTTSTVPERMKR